MTLSPAEIDRWSADAIGTVAQIVATRADGTRAVSAAIRRAVQFLDWTGDTGEAASAAISRTIRDLDSHADACDAVARAVDKAVQEVAAVKLRLRQICNTAHDYHLDRKSTRLNSSHHSISYAVFCLKKKTNQHSKTYPPSALGPSSPTCPKPRL